jgi:hypothetical protein
MKKVITSLLGTVIHGSPFGTTTAMIGSSKRPVLLITSASLL